MQNLALSFLDKAAVVAPTDHTNGSIDPWRLCSVSQVEELKAVLRLLPILGHGYHVRHSLLTNE
ncbi:putative proton-dependent oligopeptide transporter family [Helianthus annuus]|uniref:Proton-dependent oligopeptide transporter family n=1 Tax=Helianthus annuus TaxID=4232 RepID=A0A9K3GXI8_HELAN|nr:putative proton-dependent oligopeptide transporter family [Helianthus annuus]